MDEATIARMDRAARRRARRRWWGADPAIDADDIAQSAWLRMLPRLTDERGEAEQTRYLMAAVGSCAIEAYRTTARRPRGEFGEWLEARQDAADEAIARAELGPLLARAGAGDRAVLALLLLACGLSWAEVTAAVGCGRTTLHRWHCARAEVLA